MVPATSLAVYGFAEVSAPQGALCIHSPFSPSYVQLEPEGMIPHESHPHVWPLLHAFDGVRI